MTHREMMIAVAHLANCSVYDAHRAADSMIGAIKNALFKGESVELKNFGTFYVKRLPSRPARNPRNQAQIVTVERNTVRCRISIKLRTPPVP